MKVLLDEDVPHQLRRHLHGHDVFTVQRMGWSGITNGELTALAVEAGFDAMLTCDQNMEHQQNLSEVNLAVLVIVVRNKKMETILPLVPTIMLRLSSIEPGKFIRIE